LQESPKSSKSPKSPELSELDAGYSVPIQIYVEVGVQTEHTTEMADQQHADLMRALRSVQERADRQAKSLISLRGFVNTLQTELKTHKNPFSDKGTVFIEYNEPSLILLTLFIHDSTYFILGVTAQT